MFFSVFSRKKMLEFSILYVSSVQKCCEFYFCRHCCHPKDSFRVWTILLILFDKVNRGVEFFHQKGIKFITDEIYILTRAFIVEVGTTSKEWKWIRNLSFSEILNFRFHFNHAQKSLLNLRLWQRNGIDFISKKPNHKFSINNTLELYNAMNIKSCERGKG